MPLSWNEIKDRAFAFSREWADVGSERAEAQSFWNEPSTAPRKKRVRKSKEASA